MKSIKKHLFLGTVLTFALSLSGCAMLGSLLPMLTGMGLTDDSSDTQSELSLTSQQKLPYRVVGGAVPQPSRQEGALYSAFE
jgi:hypothetical protein